LRKAYYDAVTIEDDNIYEIYNKLKLIKTAINDPMLKGYSHRCLDILTLLKKDFEKWIFLLETQPDSGKNCSGQ
jgi:hypothetical protein